MTPSQPSSTVRSPTSVGHLAERASRTRSRTPPIARLVSGPAAAIHPSARRRRRFAVEAGDAAERPQLDRRGADAEAARDERMPELVGDDRGEERDDGESPAAPRPPYTSREARAERPGRSASTLQWTRTGCPRTRPSEERTGGCGRRTRMRRCGSGSGASVGDPSRSSTAVTTRVRSTHVARCGRWRPRRRRRGTSPRR